MSGSSGRWHSRAPLSWPTWWQGADVRITMVSAQRPISKTERVLGNRFQGERDRDKQRQKQKGVESSSWVLWDCHVQAVSILATSHGCWQSTPMQTSILHLQHANTSPADLQIMHCKLFLFSHVWMRSLVWERGGGDHTVFLPSGLAFTAHEAGWH